MRNSKTRGFTLIELLAIIVILAIIAVITVPIILNVIENSRRGAAIDSAYGYKEAIHDYYLTKLSEDIDYQLNGIYTVSDGKLIGENEEGTSLTHTILFSGTKPSSGNVGITNGVITSACLVVDGYEVELQGSTFTTSGKGDCGEVPTTDKTFRGDVITDKATTKSEETDRTIPSTGHDGVVAIVYLDPTDLSTECNATLAKANVKDNGSVTGVKSGCMKWYAYKDENGYYTMLLDHNTTESVVAWNIDNGEDTTNFDGPSTATGQALATLKDHTKDWVEAELVAPEDNYTASWTYDGTPHSYTINYSGYRARFISAEEINKTIMGLNVTNASEIVSGKLDSKCDKQDDCSAGDNKHGWLLDYLGCGAPASATTAPSCKNFGCNEGKQFDPYGYWTATAVASGVYGASIVTTSVRTVSFSGVLDIGAVYVGSSGSYGVRPVIKISKAKLGL